MNLQALFALATRIICLEGTAPTVTLDNGTFTGITSGSVSQFLGIPFAQPPVGNLRFRLPQALPPYVGKHQATRFGPSCPQQSQFSGVPNVAQTASVFLVMSLLGPTTTSSEDCLSINVITPPSARHSNLPVIVWFYGGGFQVGSTSQYDGSVIVERSIALGEPVIYVSMNYRLSGFGFLASKEVKAAGVGNLGLQDQRFALQWVQKYITAFGGDPKKVTLWGESAGGISISLQMLYNGGNTGDLFRAAFMQSGSPVPAGSMEQGQKYYDFTVRQVGCSIAADTLECLRTAPYDKLKAAFDALPGFSSYQSLVLAFSPHADGVFLADKPQHLVLRRQVARIPIVTGVCDDEGTIFTTSKLNITTDSQLETYIRTFVFPGITDIEYQAIARAYPSDVTQGSPFDTGHLNALTPQFKRIAAFDGDVMFHAPRRLFLDQIASRQNAWAFLSKRQKSVPVFGSFHGSDLINTLFGGELTDYLIHFTNHLNPNGPGLHPWPQFDTLTRSLLTFWDGLIPTSVTNDTFRRDAINVLINLSLAHPFL